MSNGNVTTKWQQDLVLVSHETLQIIHQCNETSSGLDQTFSPTRETILRQVKGYMGFVTNLLMTPTELQLVS
jgi:hypothetical protein